MAKREFIVALICTLAVGFSAFAQTGHHDGHAQYHDVYERWAIPGSYPGSCCRAKDYATGVGDCYPTEFELIDGRRWIAKRDDGVWVDVPDSRIIRERNPDPTGTRGHLCYSDYQQQVLCAVPPAGVL